MNTPQAQRRCSFNSPKRTGSALLLGTKRRADSFHGLPSKSGTIIGLSFQSARTSVGREIGSKARESLLMCRWIGLTRKHSMAETINYPKRFKSPEIWVRPQYRYRA